MILCLEVIKFSFACPTNYDIGLTETKVDFMFKEIISYTKMEEYENDKVGRIIMVSRILQDIFIKQEKEYFSKIFDLDKEKITHLRELIMIEERLGLKNILNNKKGIISSLEEVYEKNKKSIDAEYRLVFNIEQLNMLNDFLISPFITQENNKEYNISSDLIDNKKLKTTQKQKLF
jgi:hypothetical protein